MSTTPSVKVRVRVSHLGEVGRVDARGDASCGNGPHVGDEPLGRVEADYVDALMGCEAEGHEALAEPTKNRSKIWPSIDSVE